jgi:copper homeostasis protein
MTIKIELCAASIEAIEIARKLNLDRIELCQDLEQGGLTPSAGLIQYAVSKNLETHVLIRPRAGGFNYSDLELEVILNDIQIAKKLGAKGIVVGVLKANFELDISSLEKITAISEGMELTFHRAFDESINWKKSIDALIELRFNRILTSGFASNVEIGFENLKKMVEFAENQIEIMPGGGINAANIAKIINEISPKSIHFSGTVKSILDEDSLFSETILKVEEKRVKRLVEFISKSNQNSFFKS